MKTTRERAEEAIKPLLNPDVHPFQENWSDAHSMSGETLIKSIESAINEAVREATEPLVAAIEDLLNHGLQYENGEIHQADPNKAAKLVAAHKERSGS